MARAISNKKIFKDLIKAKSFTKQYPKNKGFIEKLNKTIKEKYDERKITYEQYQILKNC